MQDDWIEKALREAKGMGLEDERATAIADLWLQAGALHMLRMKILVEIARRMCEAEEAEEE